MGERDTKQRILDTSIQLFGRHGYGNVSMRDIAGQVGIKASSLYNYFAGKEEILETAVDEADQYLEHLRFTAGDIRRLLVTHTPREILKRFVSFYNDEDDTRRMALYRLLYMEMYNSTRVMRFAYAYFIKNPVRNLQLVLDALTEAGAIPRGDNLATAQLWSRTSTLYGYIAAHNHENVTWAEYDAMTEYFIDMAVRGVRAIPVAPAAPPGDTPGAGEQQELPSGTRELILHRALDLFARHGYAGVTVRQIADSVGIRPASIYSHFPGKESIMQEIAEHFLTRLQMHTVTSAAFRRVLAAGDLQGIIQTLAGGDFTRRRQANRVYRVLFREQYANAAVGKIFLDTLQRDKQNVERIARDLQDRGIIPACDCRRLAIAYVHTMCSLSMDSVQEEELPRGEESLCPRLVAQLVSLARDGYLDQS